MRRIPETKMRTFIATEQDWRKAKREVSLFPDDTSKHCVVAQCVRRTVKKGVEDVGIGFSTMNIGTAIWLAQSANDRHTMEALIDAFDSGKPMPELPVMFTMRKG